MSKIGIISDVHGRTFWKDIKDFKDGEIVFLGDYLDPYPYEFEGIDNYKRLAIDNFKEIIDFAKENKRVHLLLGNHDAQSISLSDSDCRTDHKNLKEIFNLYNDNKNLFNIAYEQDNIIFTHAGICEEWLNVHNIKKDNIIDKLNNMFHSVELQLPHFGWSGNYNYIDTPLGDIGRSRGGYAPVGSCVWADITDILHDPAFKDEKIQIFGHTQLEKTGNIVHRDNWYCCDSRSCFIWDEDKLVVYNKE